MAGELTVKIIAGLLTTQIALVSFIGSAIYDKVDEGTKKIIRIDTTLTENIKPRLDRLEARI